MGSKAPEPIPEHLKNAKPVIPPPPPTPTIHQQLRNAQLVSIPTGTFKRLEESERQLQAILALCRAHAHPGVNPGAHALACEVLKLAGERGEPK